MKKKFFSYVLFDDDDDNDDGNTTTFILKIREKNSIHKWVKVFSLQQGQPPLHILFPDVLHNYKHCFIYSSLSASLKASFLSFSANILPLLP
jgi:hypothetical protein